MSFGNYDNNKIIIMESIYIALFQLSSKGFDTHYYPDRPGINLKPSQIPGKYTGILVDIWSSGKLPIQCKKNWQKLYLFFKNIDKKNYFFTKNCWWQLFWKNDNLKKKSQVLGNFLPLNWQFSGGSDPIYSVLPGRWQIHI